MYYEGKTVCITGASRGIGLELAKLMLERGARVHTIARSQLPALSPRHVHHVADLHKQMPDLERLEFDILVLNVGMNPGGRRYDDLDLAEVEECVHMNVMVHLKFLKACPHKKVAFINSVTSLVGVPNYALYCASKAFISVFNEALVREGKDTYIVYPYKVNTELFKEMRDFGTIDKTRLARLIVSDLERGVRQRTVPCIFALVPLLCALLPTCVITGLVRLMMRFLSR